MFYHIPDDDNVELVVQFGYFVDILADQCQVSVVGMYAVDFFCDCNLASVDVYAGHLATEIQALCFLLPRNRFRECGNLP